MNRVLKIGEHILLIIFSSEFIGIDVKVQLIKRRRVYYTDLNINN